MAGLHRWPLASFFLLAFAFSWATWIGGLTHLGPGASMGEAIPFVYVGSFGPTVAAIVMLATGSHRRQGLRQWARSFVRVKAHPGVYVAALLGLPIAYGLLWAVLGVRPLPGDPSVLVWVTLILMAPVNGFVGSVVLGAGPLGEEPGWRGYALDRLLEARSDWAASGILGLIWALWHLPIMVGIPEWRAGVTLPVFLPTYAIGVVALAYAFTKVWRWSRGSLFLVIWFHGIVNFSANYAVDRRVWDLDAFSDLELHLVSGTGILLLALVLALVTRWRDAR